MSSVNHQAIIRFTNPTLSSRESSDDQLSENEVEYPKDEFSHTEQDASNTGNTFLQTAVRIRFWDTNVEFISQRFVPWFFGMDVLPSPTLDSIRRRELQQNVDSQVPALALKFAKDDAKCLEGTLSPLLTHSQQEIEVLNQVSPQELMIHPTYHIIFYKENRIVLYDSEHSRVGVRLIRTPEEKALFFYCFSVCPMCGQTVKPNRFSYESQSYFRLLQEIIRAHAETRQSPFMSRRTSADPSENVQEQRTKNFQWFPALKAVEERESENKDAKRTKKISSDNPYIAKNKNASSVKHPQKDYSSASSSSTSWFLKNLSSDILITGYYAAFFHEKCRLGSGSFGQVFLCHHVLDDVYLGEYAIKKVPVGDSREWLLKMLREVKIRERLHNTNIVQYKHSWLEMCRTANTSIMIPWLFVLMEYCNGGDLEKYLFNEHYVHSFQDTDSNAQVEEIIVMPESHIWKLFFDIANGLNHLHRSGILHRDLKPGNILLQCTLDTVTGRPSTTALLSDFGTSELLSESRRNRQGFTGTIEFTAPELLEHDEYGHLREDYDEKSDIWSLGVILFMMAYGSLPYNGLDPKECRKEILKHSDPRTLIPSTPKRSDDLRLLIEGLLQRNPNTRPSIDAILNHRRTREHMLDKSLQDAGYEITYNLGCRQYRETHPRSSSGLHSPSSTRSSYPAPTQNLNRQDFVTHGLPTDVIRALPGCPYT